MLQFDSILFIIAFIVLLAQFVIFYFKLGLKMIAHPGTFFALIWLFSTISQYFLIKFDLAIIKDIDSINELNIFVIFTSVFFSLWQLFYKYESYSINKTFNFKINYNLYKKLLIVMLVGAILQMLYTWYSIGVSSFNIAEIRDLNTSDKTNYFGTQADLLLSLIKYTQFFYPVLSIFSGYFLGLKYLSNQRLPFKDIFIYIPLIVALLYVLTSGGRNPLFIGIKLYAIGLFFTLPLVLPAVKRRWLLVRIAVLAITLSIFSTFVSDARSEFNNQDSFSSNFDNPILNSVSGLIEYMGAHYYGYQLRNVDTFDEAKLGYGYFTFNSLFDMKVPFATYIGFEKNIGNFFGYDVNPIDYFYLWENDKEGYYTTNSIYLDLKLDFGYVGTILFLLFFTRYTHKLFLKTQNKDTISIYVIFWYFMCFNFWAASNFNSFYADYMIEGLVMFFIFSRLFTKNISLNWKFNQRLQIQH
ncbi:O-antigen polymerase [Flavobacterium chungnamense]|uniref:Oligosaccharide repeat unit polymerase n=1 Tax=Flavobacterium chungnamense TaxID=706182 RepID=A0ABP7UWL1_9FLAO